VGKVIGVFSGKGGVGKTTLVANLATSLTKNFNKKVVVVDSNFSTSHLGLHFGLYEEPKVTLRDVILENESLVSAFYIHPSTGVRLIPAPISGSLDEVVVNGLANVVEQLKEDNDIVILDAAPGLGREVITTMKSIDEALIIATPDIPSITDALKTTNLIKKVNDKINISGVIVNRVRNEKYELTRKEIESACNTNVVTHIPEDSKVPESIAKGVPLIELHPYSKASVAFGRLAAAMVGQTYEPRSFVYALMKLLGIVKEGYVKIPPRIERQQRVKKVRLKKDEEEKQTKQQKEKGKGREKEDEMEDVKKLHEEVEESIKSDIKKRLAMKIKEKLREKGVGE